MTLTNNITPTISDQTLLDNLSPQNNNNNNNSEQQTVVQLTAIRRLKNAIIGNRRKKLLFAQMGAIPIVCQLLNQSNTNVDILIQAAATIGSFGKSDSPDCARSLHESRAIVSLVHHVLRLVKQQHQQQQQQATTTTTMDQRQQNLCQLLQEKQLKLLETCVRSLKIIYETEQQHVVVVVTSSSSSSCCGGDSNNTLPSTNNMLNNSNSNNNSNNSNSHGGEHQLLSFDLLLGMEGEDDASSTIPCLIHLLSPVYINVWDSMHEVTASLLARCCTSQVHQQAIAAAGGLEALLTLLELTHYPKTQESVVDALASLCINNVPISNRIAMNHSVLSKVMHLVRDSKPSTRLLAVKLLANLNKCGSLQNQVHLNDITSSVLPVLVKLMGDGAVVKDQTPNILATLISGSEELQKAACDANAVPKLVSFLQDSSVTDLMRVNCLNALAELCMMREQGRRLLIESKVLPYLIQLLPSSNEQIKCATLACIKGISRATKHFRLSLIECGILNNLFQLLNDASLVVRREACAVIANLSLDFSPVKQFVFNNGGVEILVSLTASNNSSDVSLRTTSLIALSNLVSFSESNIKDSVVTHLTIPRIFELLDDREPKIQECSLQLVRNLIHGHTSRLSMELIAGQNGSRLLSFIETCLSRSAAGSLNDATTIQLLYVLSNMIVCINEQQQATVLQSSIIQNIFTLMKHTNAEIRSSLVWILINTTWKGDAGYKERIEQLRQLNVEEKLQDMLTQEPSIDVRDRVRQCLEQINLGQRTRQPEDEDIEM